MHGLTRSLLNNMVTGVTEGFSKSLEINGVGYRVQQKKEYLIFTLGYSHLIYYEIPAGLEVKVDSTTALTILACGSCNRWQMYITTSWLAPICCPY